MFMVKQTRIKCRQRHNKKKTVKTLKILVLVWFLFFCWTRAEGYTGAVSRIVAGQDDLIAAESLQGYCLTKYQVQINIVDPNDAGSGGGGCEILLGTQATNPYLAQIAEAHSVDINQTSLTEDGYVLRTLQHEGRDVVLAASGGKRGVFYSVGELKNYYLSDVNNSVVVLLADVFEVPALKYRWLWTWDNRMEWEKEPFVESQYLDNYKTCIDYMSENGFNGLIIWGFLRSAHGGVTAGQELCDYAVERGVRILPGAGTCFYGGFYYDGFHAYNAIYWILQHPELEAIVTYMGSPVHFCTCPSKQANQDWLQEGAEWLFTNFQVGGVNLEEGDMFVCQCDDCKLARAAIDCNYPDFYKDIAICEGPLTEAMLQMRPDAWLSYATYSPFTSAMMTNPPKFIEMFPPEAICQWTIDELMVPGKWPPGLKPMTENSVGYLHWANKFSHTEKDFLLEGLRTAAYKSHLANMEGLAIYGELPNSPVNMELNYLAFREYCFHPDLSQEAFTEKRLAPLYSEQLTDELWQIINLVYNSEQRTSIENIAEAHIIATAALAEAPDYAREHWQDIVAYLQSFACTPLPYECDLIEDGFIDWADLAAFAGQWLGENCQVMDWCEGADFDKMGSVDLTDFAILTQYWLKAAPAPPIGPVGWWKLDETEGTSAADSGAFNNEGTLMNGLSFSNDSVEGRIGNALHFDGLDDKVVVPGLSLPSGNRVTIAMWFNPDFALDSGTGRVDFTYWQQGGGHPNITMLDRGKISFRCYLNEYDTVVKVSTTTDSWAAGTWYHIAGTYDGFELKIYVNGILENTLGQLGTNRAATGFYFGNGSIVPFEGKIDDVRIYNRALSDQEIADPYNQ
jgi:hypothetical protein